MDDSMVQTTSLQKALSQRAYILFYVRDKEQVGGQDLPKQQPEQQQEKRPQQQEPPQQQQPQQTSSAAILTSLKTKLTKLATPQPAAASAPAPIERAASSPHRQWTLAISRSKGAWYQTPSDHNIFQTQRPVTMPFQPAATVNNHDGRQQNKRAMEEAEYDKGKQKKVRRKQEWDASVHNAFQATAKKKWAKEKRFKTRI